MSTLAYKRLTSEYRKLLKDPVDLIQAKPQDNNLLIWHFILDGPPNTPYSGGQYYGIMTFPASYPMNPPSLKVITPSGRFVPGEKLCITMTNYHSEQWNPTWSVSSILVGLVSFMSEESGGIGSIERTPKERKAYARDSRRFNNNRSGFKKHFPDVVELNKEKMTGFKKDRRTQAQATVPTTTSSTATATPVTTPATTIQGNKQSKRQRVKAFFTKSKK